MDKQAINKDKQAINKDKQAINKDKLEIYVVGEKVVSRKRVTMSGELRTKVTALNRDGKTDIASTITNEHKLELQFDYKGIDIDTLCKLCSEAQSLTVYLQNTFLRNLSDEKLKKLVKGEEELVDSRFTIKNGVMIINVKELLAQKGKNGLSKEEKEQKVIDNASEETILRALKNKFPNITDKMLKEMMK